MAVTIFVSLSLAVCDVLSIALSPMVLPFGFKNYIATLCVLAVLIGGIPGILSCGYLVKKTGRYKHYLSIYMTGFIIVLII